MTVNRGSPRTAEPKLPQVWYPQVKKVSSAATSVTFATKAGLTWDRITSAALGDRGPVLSGQPVFRLKVNDQEITSAQFQVLKVEHPAVAAQGLRITASCERAGLALKALLDCQADGPQGARLTLDLSNAGPQAVTGTLFFPTLTRLSLGDPSETWCFCGRRGAW